MQTVLLILAMGFLCAGCVQTRSPQPVALKQSGDGELTCDQIAVEYKTNTEVALKEISKNRSGDTQDILVGFFIWPGLADFQNADGTEGNALLDRNVYLREIATDKSCKGMEHWPRKGTATTVRTAGVRFDRIQFEPIFENSGSAEASR